MSLGFAAASSRNSGGVLIGDCCVQVCDSGRGTNLFTNFGGICFYVGLSVDGAGGAVGSISTLRDGTEFAVLGSTLRTGILVALVMLVRSSISRCKASMWLSGSVVLAVSVDGLLNAWAMILIPAIIWSFAVTCGMVTLVGNHEMVSQIRSLRVSQIHTLWQR